MRAGLFAGLGCAEAVVVGALISVVLNDAAPVERTLNAPPTASEILLAVPEPQPSIAPPTPQPTRRPPPVPVPGLPERLVIPRLGVDSAVVPITAPGGVLTPPGDAQQVGWWSDGAQPGAAQGSALVTGHTLSRGGAALQDLETLTPGDRITVRTGQGRIVYRVQGVQTFSKGSVADQAQELFSQSAPGRLVVITCEDYNGSIYLSNVVVTAMPLGAPVTDVAAASP